MRLGLMLLFVSAASSTRQQARLALLLEEQERLSFCRSTYEEQMTSEMF